MHQPFPNCCRLDMRGIVVKNRIGRPAIHGSDLRKHGIHHRRTRVFSRFDILS